MQTDIIATLGVKPSIDVTAEVERRIGFLSNYLMDSSAAGYVLGISGGVDSMVAGRLAQIACADTGALFTAMRLPYGEQTDEEDAQLSLKFIDPDETVTVDIDAATAGIMEAINNLSGLENNARFDFVKGNVKARQRMVAQYAVAGARGSLVVGTDHAAEAVMGFFTKFGDGACDVTPLSGLTKGQVRQIGVYLGAPEGVIWKAPTADLEDLRPGLKDEDVHGITYDVIDACLRGEKVAAEAAIIIESTYVKTEHKRNQPVGPA